MNKIPVEQYNQEETALRRDAVIRRIANTPPQPKTKLVIAQKRKGKLPWVAWFVRPARTVKLRPEHRPVG